MKTVRTDEELNRVIAVWCGWEFIPSRDVQFSHLTVAMPERWEHEDLPQTVVEIPNYCKDLNAIHEAVMKIPKVHRMQYALVLSKGKYDDVDVTWNVINATARQRAEALVTFIESVK